MLYRYDMADVVRLQMKIALLSNRKKAIIEQKSRLDVEITAIERQIGHLERCISELYISPSI